MRRFAGYLLLASASVVILPHCSAQTQTPVTTLKAKTRIVVIDVGVTDAQGHPVRNLKALDFALKENGTPQTISHVEEYSALPSALATTLPEMPKLEPNVFTNYSPVPPGALNVLLLDALNTPPEDQMFVRSEMLKYLKAAHPGTRMAIFGLNSDLKLLQGFTSDPQVLRNAVGGVNSGPKMTDYRASETSLNPEPQAGPADVLIDTAVGNIPDAGVVQADLRQFNAVVDAFLLQSRIRLTIEAMSSLARYLSGLPGRKNLIWFSGSFPLNVMPDGSLKDPFDVSANYENEFKHTTDLLIRSQVAVYPIDARGLRLAPQASAVNSGGSLSVPTAAVMRDTQKFFTDTDGSHATMKDMANDTGGIAYVDSNGLSAAVQQAIEAGSNFYSLTYTPSNRDWKEDFRKVQVDLAKAGLKLTYRHGYFADAADKPLNQPPESPTSTRAANAPAKSEAKAAMRAAMQFGGPDPTEILFKASINPATDKTEPAVAHGNVADPDVLGPFKRYVVTIAALPTDFTIVPAAEGKHRMSVELVTHVCDENGVVMNSATVRASGDIDDARYQMLMRSGLQFRQEISVPARGESFLRIGVHDLMTDHVGAVEIPIARVAKLQPVANAVPPAAAVPPR